MSSKSFSTATPTPRSPGHWILEPSLVGQQIWPSQKQEGLLEKLLAIRALLSF